MTGEFINNLSITTPLVDSTDVAKGYGVSNVEIGDYIAFETFDGIKGVLKIISTSYKFQYSIAFDAKMVVKELLN